MARRKAELTRRSRTRRAAARQAAERTEAAKRKAEEAEREAKAAKLNARQRAQQKKAAAAAEGARVLSLFGEMGDGDVLIVLLRLDFASLVALKATSSRLCRQRA